jgi:hypothetical protein
MRNKFARYRQTPSKTVHRDTRRTGSGGENQRTSDDKLRKKQTAKGRKTSYDGPVVMILTRLSRLSPHRASRPFMAGMQLARSLSNLVISVGIS